MPIANPNYFTGNPLQRLSEQRGDADWLDQQVAHPKAKLMALWKGQPLLDGQEPLKLLWLNMVALSEFGPNTPLCLLGFRDDVPYFAVDGSAVGGSPETAPMADLGTYEQIRAVAGKMDREELAIYGQAYWLLDWHRRHQFCAKCGSASKMHKGGTMRKCDICETEHFPRTDPVAIVLVIHDGACLMGRGVNFPPGFYSALAGFVEPGESLEECAAREIFEEAGVRVDNIRYQFNQPWPISSSLMVGFLADTQSRELDLDKDEIAEAIWLPQKKLQAMLNGERDDAIFLPPKFTIARQLLEVWAKE